MERESDMPKDWKSNVVFFRDGFGTIKMVEVPDDIEQNEGEK